MTLGNRIGRIVAMLAALVLALTITACSGTKAPTGEAGSGGSSGIDPANVPSTETTLTVWSFLPGNYEAGKETYQKVTDAFTKKYPQVKIKLVDMPYPTYFDQVRNATVARSGPDVITMYGGAQAYSYRNGLVPMQDSLLSDVKDNIRFLDDNYSKDGNLYILPVGMYGYALLVNKSMFEKAGLDPAQGLGSWSSLLDTCKALSAKGIQPFAAGWQDGYLFETFMYMISSQMMDSDTLARWIKGEIPVDDPLFVNATNHIMDMNAADCFGGKDNLGLNMYDDAFNQYYAGKAAILTTGSLSTAATGAEKVPSTMVLPLPQVPDSKHTEMIDAGAEAGWSVTKWTKSPEAAAAFVNFMGGTEAQGILWEGVGVPPNRTDMTVEPKTPIQKQFLPLLELPDNHTGFASFPLTVLAVYERNAAPLIGGTMSVDEFTSQAQAAFRKSR